MWLWIVGIGIGCLLAPPLLQLLLSVVRGWRLTNKTIKELPRLWPEQTAPMLGMFNQEGVLQRFLQKDNWFEADGTIKPVQFFGYFSDGAPIVVFSNPEHFQQLLDDQQFPKYPLSYDLLAELIGHGLVVSNGELWHQQRKLITPSFHLGALKWMAPAMTQTAQEMVAELRQLAAANTPVMASDFFAKITSRIIGRTAFGDLDSNMDQHWKELNVAANPHILIRLLLGRPLANFLRLPPTRRFQAARTKVDHSVREAIKRRRQELIESASSADQQQKPEEASNFLSALLLARDPVTGQLMPEQRMIDEALTFAFAGNDTTSSTMGFLCYELSLHPDVQAQLQREVDEVVGRQQPVAYQHYNELKLTKAALKETLRLHPPAPFLERLVPTTREVCGHTLEAGTMVMLMLANSSRDPRYWKQPERFNPARWFDAAENGTSHTYTFLPFSAGARNCVGQKFALLELTILAATLMQHFTILQSPNPDQRVPLPFFEGTVKPLRFHCCFAARP